MGISDFELAENPDFFGTSKITSELTVTRPELEQAGTDQHHWRIWFSSASICDMPAN
jgi:TonB family protein